MGAKRLPRCRHCGCKFRPDRYNEHHQEWCSKPECRRARDRERKRRHYQRRLEREAGFRESERKRCREAMRRCRSRRKKTEAAREAALLPLPPTEELLTGLISHFVDTIDPGVLSETMDRYARRGRLLATLPGNRGSP